MAVHAVRLVVLNAHRGDPLREGRELDLALSGVGAVRVVVVLLLLVVREGRRTLTLVPTEVRRTGVVVAATHLVHVVRGVLEELVGRRVHRRHAVEVAAGDELGVVATVATHVVRRLALDLGLDALAVGRVADHGWTDARV